MSVKGSLGHVQSAGIEPENHPHQRAIGGLRRNRPPRRAGDGRKHSRVLANLPKMPRHQCGGVFHIGHLLDAEFEFIAKSFILLALPRGIEPLFPP